MNVDRRILSMAVMASCFLVASGRMPVMAGQELSWDGNKGSFLNVTQAFPVSLSASGRASGGNNSNAVPIGIIQNQDSLDAHLLQELQWGNLDEVKIWINSGASPNAKTAQGTSALMIATDKGDVEIMQVLLERGAFVRSRNAGGMTALIYAIRNDHLNAVNLLLKFKAPVDQRGGTRDFTPLLHAAKLQNPAIAQALLAAGADPNEYSGDNTALILAVPYSPQVISALIQAGALVDFVPGNGPSPLEKAISKELQATTSADTVALLLEKGANANRINTRGETPLRLAIRGAPTKVVEQLLAAGADLPLADNEGMGPLHWAISGSYHRSDCIELLVAAGASVNQQDKNGWTALMLLAPWSHKKDSIRLLLKSGANPNIRNNQGHSALAYADKVNAEILKEYGAKP